MLTIALLTHKIKSNPTGIVDEIIRIFELFPSNQEEWNFLEKTTIYIFEQTEKEASSFFINYR